MSEGYVKKRERLIPQAVAFAKEAAGEKPEKGTMKPWEYVAATKAWGDKWNKAYHGKMKELVKEAGI